MNYKKRKDKILKIVDNTLDKEMVVLSYRINDTEKPDFKFELTDEQLTTLINHYQQWIETGPEEKHYIEDSKQLLEEIQGKLLNKNILENSKSNKFYNNIYEYSRKLEGPVSIHLGESRIRSYINPIKRNLLYILDSNSESPFMKAEKVISKNGEFKIKYLSKAFWTPIFQAAFP